MAVARWLDSSEADTWDSRVEDVEPEVKFRDPRLQRQIKVVDLLSHNTGMTTSGLYRGSRTSMLIEPEHYIHLINDQVAFRPDDTDFYYNNLGYKLAGLILEKHIKDWSSLVKEWFVNPWNMSRTFTGHPEPDESDVSEAFGVLRDGKQVTLSTSGDRPTSFAKASGGMFSCVKDLLEAYVHVMNAVQDPTAQSSVIKQAHKLFEPRTAIRRDSEDLGHYCMGLVSLMLPGRMGYTGTNCHLLPVGESMPTIGKGVKPTRVFYHQGAGTGALAAMAIVPDLDTVVVVLSNTFGLNDCPDWVLQLVVDKMLGGELSEEQLLTLANSTRQRNLDKHVSVESQLPRDKARLSPDRLASYAGTYWNTGKYFKIEVALENEQLHWTFQGRQEDTFSLYHLEGDSFHWLGPRDEMASCGFLLPKEEHYWKVEFDVRAGAVAGLWWVHDKHNKDAGYFEKG
jgi:CubicO group peptidase (beta-lactamase class C family)